MKVTPSQEWSKLTNSVLLRALNKLSFLMLLFRNFLGQKITIPRIKIYYYSSNSNNFYLTKKFLQKNERIFRPHRLLVQAQEHPLLDMDSRRHPDLDRQVRQRHQIRTKDPRSGNDRRLLDYSNHNRHANGQLWHSRPPS